MEAPAFGHLGLDRAAEVVEQAVGEAGLRDAALLDLLGEEIDLGVAELVHIENCRSGRGSMKRRTVSKKARSSLTCAAASCLPLGVSV